MANLSSIPQEIGIMSDQNERAKEYWASLWDVIGSRGKSSSTPIPENLKTDEEILAWLNDLVKKDESS